MLDQREHRLAAMEHRVTIPLDFLMVERIENHLVGGGGVLPDSLAIGPGSDRHAIRRGVVLGVDSAREQTLEILV